MEKERFGEFLNALRLIRSVNPEKIDVLRIAEDTDLTPEQKAAIRKEFEEAKKEKAASINFENDYF